MKKIVGSILSLTILSGLFCSAAFAQIQPTLSLDFEEDANGIGRDGKIIAPRLDGQAVFEDGKFGKALKSGPGGGYLNFPTAEILRPEEGTVEMWVSPVDWDGTEQFFHTFFDARGEGVLYLYKFWNSGLLLLSGQQVGGPFSMVGAAIEQWKPGEWHHIVGVWSLANQVVYIDGKRVGSSPSNLPKSLGKEFFLGDTSWSDKRTSSSLIDRVRVYDRALSDEHIAAHFAGDYSKTVPLTDQSLRLSYSIDSASTTGPRTLNARATTQGVDIENGTRLSFVVQQNKRDVLTLPAQEFTGTVTGELPLATLKPGTYEIVATAENGGKQMARTTQKLVVPELEWMGNKLGLNAGVLPPWTPLKIKRDGKNISIDCWNRTYQFNGAPLPTQIVAKGEAMLAAPVALKIMTGGKELSWANGAIKILSASPERVTLQGSAQTESEGKTIKLQTDMSLEYDGLMVVKTRLNAPEGFVPESVQLDIPVRTQNAMYNHRWAGQWKGFSGLVPASMGVVDKTSFVPFAWLGDNDRGLFWFCESGQNWPNYAAENALETIRDPKMVSLRLNLLAKGQSTPQNWNYQFGLQATPVKPIPRDWRKWRFQPAKSGKVAITWPEAPPNNKDAMKYFGSPIATDPATLTSRINKLHAKKDKVVPYSWLTYISSDVPEWKWFEKEWRNGMTDAAGLDYTWAVTWDGTNPQSRSFSDYVIWRNHEFMRDFKLDGYYHDQAHPYPLHSDKAGVGWRDAKGQLQPIFPLLAYRDLYRRLYAMAKTKNPDAFLMAHMSGKIAIPFLAYEDSVLNGENLIEGLKDSYMDIVGLDYWRAELRAQQWGLMPYFLPEFRGEHAKGIEATRGLAALVMLHDVAVWPIWSNVQVWDEMYDALDKFGYVDSDFIGYFDRTPPGSTDMKDVYISVYKRSDGRALAIVGNTSRENRSGTVTLDAKRLGLQTNKVLSWPDKKALKSDGGKIKLGVPRLGYRMLLIGKTPPALPSAKPPTKKAASSSIK